MGAEAATSSDWNTYIRDNFKAIGDAWTSYTPALVNWTLSNGTLTGYYMQAGKLVWGKVFYTVGSTDTKSGNLVITLPVTKLADDGTETPFGYGGAYDTSVPARNTVGVFHSTTSRMLFWTPTSGIVSNTVPWTWATGDKLNAAFCYEAA
jgi:hypothetical protein